MQALCQRRALGSDEAHLAGWMCCGCRRRRLSGIANTDVVCNPLGICPLLSGRGLTPAAKALSGPRPAGALFVLPHPANPVDNRTCAGYASPEPVISHELTGDAPSPR